MTSNDIMEFSKELQSIYKDAEEYRALKNALYANRDFMVLKQQLLDQATSTCYGPWLGGDFYDVAIKHIIDIWSKGEKTESAVLIEKLNSKNATLALRNKKMEEAYLNAGQTMMSVVCKIYALRSRLGPDFMKSLEHWIVDTAGRLEKTRAEEAKNKSKESPVSPEE